jgi:paired amphipathic helix protein Sin3a
MQTGNKPEDGHFFAHVKRSLDSRETYTEFLKLVNLFTQGFIDRSRLVKESRSFLGDRELMMRWKEILGWDESKELFGGPTDKRERGDGVVGASEREKMAGLAMKADINIKQGSYRRLPESVSVLLLSGPL